MSYFWLPLDNAAKIYPAVTTREHTTVFRLSATLDHPVNYNKLKNAVDVVSERFPYFSVRLRKGFFWYYLEYIQNATVPVADLHGFCRRFNRAPDSKLFRVLAVKNCISVEYSHVLTDGAGALRFFISLITAYFQENIQDIPASDTPDEEVEDAYNKYFKSDIPPVIQYSKAFHLPFKPDKKFGFSVLVFRIPLNSLKESALQYGVSITDYLVSVYLYALQEIFQEQTGHRKRKILRIQVPVNLRNIYKTRTMRNFSLFVLPEIDLRLGFYTFEEIVKVMHHRMRLETDSKMISKIIHRNVRSEKNPIVRGIPLFIKDLILYSKYYSQGANQYSGVITNLGKIEFPGTISERIKNLVFIPPPPNKKLKINAGIIGFRDNLMISFGNISNSRNLETKFIRFLTQNKIPVKLIGY